MSSVIAVVLILAVLFLLYLFFKKRSETFSHSLGGFLIKWDADPSAESYNIVIKDENGNTVDFHNGLTSNQYFFKKGDWGTEYTTEVYSVNDAGISSPSTVVYTSPKGPYIPSSDDISNIRVVGATKETTTAPLQNVDTSIKIGDELYGLAVTFDSKTSYASPNDVAQLPFTNTYTETPSKDLFVNGVYSYGMIIYESYTTGERSYYLLSGDMFSTLWTPIIKEEESKVVWSSSGLDASSRNEPSCSKAIVNPPFPKIYFSGSSAFESIGCVGECPCPIVVSPGDRFITILLFVQPYSGAYSTLTKVQSFTKPSAPANLSYSWEPVEGFSSTTFLDKMKRMTPEDVKNFILQHSNFS